MKTQFGLIQPSIRTKFGQSQSQEDALLKQLEASVRQIADASHKMKFMLMPSEGHEGSEQMKQEEPKFVRLIEQVQNPETLSSLEEFMETGLPYPYQFNEGSDAAVAFANKKNALS